MDLVNSLFAKTLLILPGDYATLNSHWETNDIPVWWQGTIPDEVSAWQLQATPTPELSETEEPSPSEQPPPQQPSHATVGNGTTNETFVSPVNPTAVKARNVERTKMDEEQEIYKSVLHEVYADVKVLHFTALGKPWSWHGADIDEARPFAHELFKEQFWTWQNASMRLCDASLTNFWD